MSEDHTLLHAVHEVTHRMPGVPHHRDHANAGHHGQARHGRSLQTRAAGIRHTGPHQGAAPAHERPPRVLVRWQTWIAARFSQNAG